MNKEITKTVWKLRHEIEANPNAVPISLVHVCGNTYQLLTITVGCDNACTFCNYGFDEPATVERVVPVLKNIKLDPKSINTLELEANGSFLSEREIPEELRVEILKYVANRGIDVIEIETHYRTITEHKLNQIRSILGEKQEIVIEFGFESSNPDVRESYNKEIDLEQFKKTMMLLQKYKIHAEVNVLFGAPFMTRKEQIQDSLNSLDWIFKNLPSDTTAVLFPINIKKHTMFDVWSEQGKYQEINSWSFVEMLNQIPQKYLDRVSIGWWGNRTNTFTEKWAIQFPCDCPKCHEQLQHFYDMFYKTWDVEQRKNMLEEILKHKCKCASE